MMGAPTRGRNAQRRSAPAWSVSTGSSNPWHALWAMMVGFFMILVDSTIVAVANPSIMEKLGTDYDTVLWVTSAYLLACAVPLLLAGRLGDQFGPKNLYIVGLTVFTAASLWCALAPSIGVLVAARVLQGIGAALLTPQTLSMITRIFPPERRGAATSVWGATAGVATLVGPLAGGVLVDHLGWQWIFLVNVPIGVIGLVLAVWLIPSLPTNRRRFDVLGVLLSGGAMFLVVFGLQEGEDNHWSLWIWGMVAAGLVLMAAFVYWQAVNTDEPLIPLSIFADRNFSLANVGVAVIGFVVTAMIVPAMFYAQVVCGLTPTESALLTAPMAIATGVLAPVVGRIVDRAHPGPVVGFGFSMLAVSLTWLSIEMAPATPIWRLVLPFVGMGVGMAFIWTPLAATATRDLPPDKAGAGSGVYNAVRQVGSVLGSAGIAAFMSSRIGTEVPDGRPPQPAGAAVAQLPEFLREPFAAALSQSMLLPAFVALFGVIAAMFLLGAVAGRTAGRGEAPRAPRGNTALRARVRDTAPTPAADPDPVRYPDGFVHDDDDSYIELIVIREPDTEPVDPVSADDGVTEPLGIRVERPRHAPADTWHSAPVESWRSLLTEPDPGDPGTEPIDYGHNGFHVVADEWTRGGDGFDRLSSRIEEMSAGFADLFGRHDDPPPVGPVSSRHRLPEYEGTARSGRHYREDAEEPELAVIPEDAPVYGRHSQGG